MLQASRGTTRRVYARGLSDHTAVESQRCHTKTTCFLKGASTIGGWFAHASKDDTQSEQPLIDVSRGSISSLAKRSGAGAEPTRPLEGHFLDEGVAQSILD